MSILGNRVLRKEDPKFLTSGAVYTADLHDARALDGAATVTYVRSTVARRDGERASTSPTPRSMPGVLGVFTAADCRRAGATDGHGAAVPAADDDAAVACRTTPCDSSANRWWRSSTEHAYQAPTRPRRVAIDYEPLTAVVDLEAAAVGRRLVYPELGTNVGVDFVMFQMMKGVTDDSFFDGCDVVVRQRVINNRLHAAPARRARSVACAWDGDTLTYWNENQAPHGDLGHAAEGLRPHARDLPRDHARRRRRLRPQDGGHPRGDPAARGWRDSVGRPVRFDRDPHREHDRDRRTAATRSSTSPSVAAATARCRPIASRCSATRARTACSAASCRSSRT